MVCCTVVGVCSTFKAHCRSDLAAPRTRNIQCEYICCANVHPSKMPKTNQMQNKNDDMIENVHRSSNAIEHAEQLVIAVALSIYSCIVLCTVLYCRNAEFRATTTTTTNNSSRRQRREREKERHIKQHQQQFRGKCWPT